MTTEQQQRRQWFLEFEDPIRRACIVKARKFQQTVFCFGEPPHWQELFSIVYIRWMRWMRRRPDERYAVMFASSSLKDWIAAATPKGFRKQTSRYRVGDPDNEIFLREMVKATRPQRIDAWDTHGERFQMALSSRHRDDSPIETRDLLGWILRRADLSEDELELLHQRIAQGRTIKDIANEHGVAHQWVDMCMHSILYRCRLAAFEAGEIDVETLRRNRRTGGNLYRWKAKPHRRGVHRAASDGDARDRQGARRGGEEVRQPQLA